MLAAVLMMLFSTLATAQNDEPDQPPVIEATPQDGPTYPVSAIELRYLRDNPLHPSLDAVMDVEVTLGMTPSGYVAPRSSQDGSSDESFRAALRTMTLSEINDREPELYHASALQHILEAIRDEFVYEYDLMGVYVAPDPRDINERGEDLRGDDNAVLHFIVTTGIVTEIRTLASGERVGENSNIKPEDRINNPVHERIVRNSPVKPYSGGGEGNGETRQDLLQKRDLDEYLFWLGRHPGRRVDASLSAAQDVGGIALDYLVTENRPLVLYAQVSNTGTKNTDYLRERFGFFHTQLTNRDDILSFDFSTASFDQYNALTASYEAPFPNDRIRWRVYGSWSEFTADTVGFFNDTFEGDTWSVGAELIANFYQNRELFLDAIGGVRYQDIHVDNQAFLIEGDEQFLIPYVGLRLDRTTEWYSTRGQVTLEYQNGSVTDVDPAELTRLGRTAPDEDWLVLRWDLSQSVYLEPLLNRKAWEDPSTPKSSTLGHEVRLGFRGQYSFDNRLIPQEEMVVGGLYSVRGYPESAVAGDTALIGSAEYRMHLPRLFGIETEPGELFGQPFRVAPQYVFGEPDWDLVLKAFVDIGHTIPADKLSFEDEQTLYGAGVGIEFLYRRNFNVRLDWGFALDDLEAAQVNEGSNRLHVVATLLF